MAFFAYRKSNADVRYKLVCMFRRSAAELKDVRCLATTGVLAALHIVIETCTKIELPGGIYINFAFIGLFSIAMLYGPAVAMLAAVPCDIFPILLRGEAINPVYTVINIVMGLIYGLIVYGVRFGGSSDGGGEFGLRSFREKLRVHQSQYLRIAAAHVAVVIIINIFANTVANFLYGWAKTAFWPYFWIRACKNVIELPFDLVLLFMVCPVVLYAHERMRRRQ